MSNKWMTCKGQLLDSSSDNAYPSPHEMRKVYMNELQMRDVQIPTGHPVVLRIQSTPDLLAVAEAWPSSEISKDCVGIVSKNLLGPPWSSGEPVMLAKLAQVLHTAPKPASIIRVKLLSSDQNVHAQAWAKSSDKSARKSLPWRALLLKETLVAQCFVSLGQTICVSSEEDHDTYTICGAKQKASGDLSLEDSTSQMNLNESLDDRIWTISWSTVVQVVPEDLKPKVRVPNPNRILHFAGVSERVGGLEKEIKAIRELIEIPLAHPELFQRYGLRPPKGFLLHGPPGSGKTHLARTLAEAAQCTLLTVSGPELSTMYHGETEAKLRALFEDARRRSPSIIILDEVDTICPKREEGSATVDSRVVATLLTLMDGIEDQETTSGDSRVLVIATTNRPNAIDPALQRPGRFDREFEIGAPDQTARESILRVLLAKTPHDISNDDFRSLAAQCQGFVSADLAAAVRDAGTSALRLYVHRPSLGEPLLTAKHLATSLSHTQPSGLREHHIESPNVKWADIGGVAFVKQKLTECVEWPLLYPSSFLRLGVVPPRGILLYGPPGCSKTLTAKALATESHLNFISVKGPELVNKYVGESERSIRDVFRKARAAAPSIIFFDEIDAIAATRSSDGGGAHQGILTTLLTEMDGVQALQGVIVIGATNRPQDLDSALMRPGRLDRILFAGPPNLSGRLEILSIQTRRMAVEPGLDLSDLAQKTDGCSGAEIVSMCQNAALATMRRDIESSYVLRSDFEDACSSIRRQITSSVLAGFDLWRKASGVQDV